MKKRSFDFRNNFVGFITKAIACRLDSWFGVKSKGRMCFYLSVARRQISPKAFAGERNH